MRKTTDVLQMLYVAVWRRNRWPIISDRMYIGFTKKDVEDELRQKGVLKNCRVVKYVPADYS